VLLFNRQLPQLNCQRYFVQLESVRLKSHKKKYFKTASKISSEILSKAPFYPTFLHLSNQNKNTVKVHRVFPSHCLFPVSAQGSQIHSFIVRDSVEVVKPFMHVGTYPTRDFATLEPSRLRLPVVWAIDLFR